MSSPTIPDLPIATVANDSDEMLMRQPGGALGTDKSIQVSEVRKVNVAGLPTLVSPTTAEDSDLFIIARGGINYQIRHDQVSFRSGTKMWFYHNVFTQIGGWSLVSAGDSLLAVKGAGTYSVGGIESGVWQQDDVGGVPGQGLSVSQIPSHTHQSRSISRQRPGSTSSSSNQFYAFTDNLSGTSIKSGSVSGIQNTGGGDPHDHGDTWRPKANVGIICRKN